MPYSFVLLLQPLLELVLIPKTNKMIREFFAKEVINGVLTIVQYLEYPSTGRRVKRIIDADGQISDVIFDEDDTND